jgi:Ca2+-binding EF-hand superfamily protein
VIACAALVSVAGAVGAAEPTEDELNTAFVKADADKNGTVGLAEAKQFNLTIDTFRQANPDRNGKLDKKEFHAAVAHQFQAANAQNGSGLEWKAASRAGIRSKQIFDTADANHDGLLDLAEYVAGLAQQAK